MVKLRTGTLLYARGDILERYYIIFSGRIQGVGFRYFCQLQASLFNLTGWVRNCDNGSVELQVQGQKEKIFSFITALKKGNGFSRIEDYSMKKINIVEDDKKFSIK